MIPEFQLIKRLQRAIPRRMRGAIGIGDDAGAVAIGGRKLLLISTDAVVEGVDFVRARTAPELVGRKTLAINLSDMAAMGAEPAGFVVALGLPDRLRPSWVERFYRGLTALARKYRVPCLGGDISRAPEIFASAAVIGLARRRQTVLRSGAKPGDWIGVTGSLGGSILGRHLRFEPRVHEGLFLARRFRTHAMIDLSDGLWRDLSHILQASRVDAAIHLEALPVSGAARRTAGRGLARRAGRGREELWARVLTDGEDFELLFTLSGRERARLDRAWKKRFPGVALSWIGRVIPGKGKISWFWRGTRVHLGGFKKKGYEHFG